MRRRRLRKEKECSMSSIIASTASSNATLTGNVRAALHGISVLPCSVPKKNRLTSSYLALGERRRDAHRRGRAGFPPRDGLRRFEHASDWIWTWIALWRPGTTHRPSSHAMPRRRFEGATVWDGRAAGSAFAATRTARSRAAPCPCGSSAAPHPRPGPRRRHRTCGSSASCSLLALDRLRKSGSGRFPSSRSRTSAHGIRDDIS